MGSATLTSSVRCCAVCRVQWGAQCKCPRESFSPCDGQECADSGARKECVDSLGRITTGSSAPGSRATCNLHGQCGSAQDCNERGVQGFCNLCITPTLECQVPFVSVGRFQRTGCPHTHNPVHHHTPHVVTCLCDAARTQRFSLGRVYLRAIATS